MRGYEGLRMRLRDHRWRGMMLWLRFSIGLRMRYRLRKLLFHTS